MAQNPYARPPPSKCYKCNKLEHKSSDCPQRKMANVAEPNDEVEDDLDDLDDFPRWELIVMEDEGEQLIVLFKEFS